MVRALEDAPAIYHPSRFWDKVIELHLAMLESEGLERFKQTLNNSYFQMPLRAYWRALPTLLRSWLRHPSPGPLRVTVEAPGGARVPGPLLRFVMGLYYRHLRATDHLDLFGQIEEPRSGSPTYFVVDGRRVTQDLCNSVSEYYAIVDHLPLGAMTSNVAELGAGYGRLAYLFLAADPRVRYHVVDIPPALFVAQRYLTGALPEARAFTFRRFDSFEAVQEEMAAARLVFLEPQQLELVPDDHFNLFITISSLAEMRRDQVEHYLRLADRTCRGWIYLKQWQVSYNPFDDVRIDEDAYPIPQRWRLEFRRPSLVPGRFFERLYRSRPETPAAVPV